VLEALCDGGPTKRAGAGIRLLCVFVIFLSSLEDMVRMQEYEVVQAGCMGNEWRFGSGINRCKTRAQVPQCMSKYVSSLSSSSLGKYLEFLC
jgi:hypothetical protein